MIDSRRGRGDNLVSPPPPRGTTAGNQGRNARKTRPQESRYVTLLDRSGNRVPVRYVRPRRRPAQSSPAVVSAGGDGAGGKPGSDASVCAPVARFVGAPPAFVPADAPSAAQLPRPGKNHQPWHTEVYRLRNAPALQLAQTLSTLFASEHQAGQFDALSRAVIVPDVVSNSLIVAGPAEASAEIGKLIEALDRAAMMIRLEIAMGDVPTADLPAAEAGEKTDATKVRASVVGAENSERKWKSSSAAN